MNGSNTPAHGSGGWLNGFIGVLIFSGSLPATRIAVKEMNPLFLTAGRAVIAGMLALVALRWFKEKRPSRQQLLPLFLVALGGVIGFPLLSAWALQHVTSAHAIVFLGLLPLSTAIFGVLRGGERPGAVFWIFSIAGSLLVVGYAAAGGLAGNPVGDLLMLLAVLVCGLGYAEGAILSRTMGGWQVISWALVLSLPVMLLLLFRYWPAPMTMDAVSPAGWLCLAYVGVFSMFVGFIFWYRGLAQGGIAAVGQLQLLQPLFGLALAAVLLQEEVSLSMLGITIGVMICVAGSRRFARRKAAVPAGFPGNEH